MQQTFKVFPEICGSCRASRRILLSTDSTYCRNETFIRRKNKKTRKEVTFPKRKVSKTKHDWIGPPCESSNIRPIRFYKPEDETPLERSYREQRQELHDWNVRYWTQHNLKFYKQRDDFKKRIETSGGQKKEEMSEFYKKFLDDHYTEARNYNWEWYKKTTALLWPATKVFWYRLIFRRKDRQ